MSEDVAQLDNWLRTGEMGRFQRTSLAIARVVVTGFSKLYFRYEVHGRENLPTDSAFIISPNHRSNLDTPMLPLISLSPIRFMGKDSLWEAGWFAGFFLDTMGGFPVSRDSADRAAMRMAEEIVAGGEPLVMFPEGTRRSGPIVEPENMHSGPSFVAGRQQVPIVPVGMAGSEAAMPAGSKWVYPKKIVFVIGTPIAPPEPGPNGRVSRKQVQAHTELLRNEIQVLFDKAKLLTK